MKISYLNPAPLTAWKSCRPNLKTSSIALALVAILIAGTGAVAQQSGAVKITPKNPKPAAKKTTVTIKQTTPVKIKPVASTSKPAAPAKPVPAPNPQAQPVAAVDVVTDVIFIVDGKVLNASAIELVRGQQVMIWLRDLERIGWGTLVPEAAGGVALVAKNVKLSFRKNQDTAMVNSLTVKLPISSYMKDDKFMVPLSFVSKSLGHEYDSSYRPVAFIVTSSAPQVSTGPAQVKVPVGNTLQGTVVFAGKPVSGVKVRLVDKDLLEIEGTRTVTDPEGKFKVANLADGEYAAYVYTGDNPEYFNRATEVVAASGNQVFNLNPLSLGRIINPVAPVSGESVKAVDSGIKVSWGALDGVAEYRVILKNSEGEEIVPQVRTKEASTSIATDKLTPGTKYVLEVAAYDTNGDFIGGTPGAGGTPWTFTFTDK